MSRRDLVRTLLVALPAVMVVVGLRALHPALNAQPESLAGLPETVRSVHGGTSSWQIGELLVSIPKQRVAGYTLPHLGRYTIYPFGLTLSLLAVVGAWASPILALRLLPLILLAYAQLLVAVNTERLLVLALPAILLLAAAGLGWTLRTIHAEASAVWWTLPAGLIGVLLLSTPSYGQNLGLHLVQLAAAVVAVGLSLAVFHRRTASRAPSRTPVSSRVKGLSDGAHVVVR